MVPNMGVLVYFGLIISFWMEHLYCDLQQLSAHNNVYHEYNDCNGLDTFHQYNIANPFLQKKRRRRTKRGRLKKKRRTRTRTRIKRYLSNFIHFNEVYKKWYKLTISPKKNGDISPEYILNSPNIAKYEGFARDKWKYLKPLLHATQPDIGYAWIIRKVRKQFNSPQNAQKAMNPIWSHKWPNIDSSDLLETGNTLPCIIGPTQNNHDLRFYVIDSHHTLSALDYSEYHETYIYLNILYDFRMYEYHEFVDILKQQRNTFLYSQKGKKKQLPQMIDFNELPNIFEFNRHKKSLGDNIWRSLAGYSRKVQVAPYPFPSCTEEGDSKYCMRPYVRICDDDGFGIPFYEFIWSYFYVHATYVSKEYWNGTIGKKPLKTFRKTYDKLLKKYYDEEGNWIDPDIEKYKELVQDWQFTASLLVPLARGYMTAGYKPLQYLQRESLPGYVEGPTKVENDPNCHFNQM